ncbi:hypothetical protein FSC37_23210 [Piscinibacter aquaticus]|uniref:Uncharacterized protein n=1 Tax=Piscinibacter aquaticus TaxID=392597 RepID=A0A5C6TMX6_9BURK|nr:hypothetical protein FSC37_23210 [Piscinibacter aquaticus]
MRASDGAVQASLLNILATVMALPVEERREIVLAPSTDYQVEVGWSWQVWQPEDPNETPPDPDPTAWTSGGTDVLYFATAPDADATPAQQDGLNEFVFDARDVGRYLIGVEPANGRATQFTGDPIWAHFDAGHVKQLLDQYGRTLAIEIRRTDPKPQSTPAALDAVIAPLPLTLARLALPDALQPVGYQLIHEALKDAPCLPGTGPMGGASWPSPRRWSPRPTTTSTWSRRRAATARWCWPRASAPRAMRRPRRCWTRWATVPRAPACSCPTTGRAR